MVPSNLSQVGFLKSQVSLSGLARLLTPLGQQFAIGGRVQDLNIPKPIHSVPFAKGKIKKRKLRRADLKREGRVCLFGGKSHRGSPSHRPQLRRSLGANHQAETTTASLTWTGLSPASVLGCKVWTARFEEICSTLQLGLASGADSQQPFDQRDNMVVLDPQVHAESNRSGLLLNPFGQAARTWVNERRKLPESLRLWLETKSPQSFYEELRWSCRSQVYQRCSLSLPRWCY
jgi:hypothetical protein